jgi:L-ectoine synthase
MIVRDLRDVSGSERETAGATWVSRRLLLAGDGMGFSLHDTLLHAGTATQMQYLHHLEAVYCIEGEGEIEELDTGRVHPIRPGIVYALDRHDHHVLRARTQLRMVCVFNPPVTGREVHDERGAYPAPVAEAAAAAAAARAGAGAAVGAGAGDSSDA